MAKVFDAMLHLPIASELCAELKAGAKSKKTQATSLARQFIQEGLERLRASQPKPERLVKYGVDVAYRECLDVHGNPVIVVLSKDGVIVRRYSILKGENNG